MEVLIEQIIIYGGTGILCLIILIVYLRRQNKVSKITEQKIEKAKIHGLFEPLSLHPVIDGGSCINCGSCVKACPEKDILGIIDNRATTINASNCVGHGACFHACPVEAISLCIGTEKRGVDLPHVNQSFETNIPGIYIAGELGGMGLIRNAVRQGQQAVENLIGKLDRFGDAEYDLLIIGGGPAGISASLTAKEKGLKSVTLEQDTLGGTVFTFPRSKIVMTAPMNLPGHGKVKLFETSKTELLELWNTVLDRNKISIRENKKVEEIIEEDGRFTVKTKQGDTYTAKNVLLAIGRRGTPRKLNVPGEQKEKVAYRLLEPEHIRNKNVLVVGGGDSAIESALLLAEENQVALSYRSDVFKRLKPKNKERITAAIEKGEVEVKFNTNVKEILDDKIILTEAIDGQDISMPNDLVYIFAGGELPTKFLEKIGIKITRRFGYAILKHKKNQN
ncbi:MAG: NAD(P)-binding domain-containing protein [Saprospiraceae bacterium]|nr:NAD(P)-binding domain-containing protein [Saprospiraceae bacterium]